jgi:hypothetical protein
LPGLTRQSIVFAKRLAKSDGPAVNSARVFRGSFAIFGVPNHKVLERLGINLNPVEFQLTEIVQEWLETIRSHNLE